MRRLVVLIGIVCILGSIALLVRRHRTADHIRRTAVGRAETSWAALSSCLVGTPLRNGERATVRLRRLAGGRGEEGWPRQCAPFAAAFKRDVLALVDEQRFARLQLYLFDLEDDLQEGRIPRDVDELWQAVKLARLEPTLSPGDAALPAAAAAPPLDPSTLGRLADGAAHGVDPVPGMPPRLLFRAPPRLCAFEADARRARCRRVPETLATAELVPAEPDAPLFVRLLEPDRAGIWHADGAAAVAGPVAAATALRGGTLAVIDWSAERGYQLRRIGLAAPAVPLVDGEDFRFLGDHLVWRARHGPRSSQLVTTRVPSGSESYASMLVLGAIARDAQLAACRSGETRAVAALPAPAPAPGRAEIAVALAPDGRWLPGLHTESIDGAPAGVRLDCRPGMATLTWVTRPEGAPPDELEAHQMRCDLVGCAQREARLADVGQGATPLIGDLQGKLLAVWYHEDDSLRMRLGEIIDLPAAPERILVDAERHGGVDAEGLELHVQADAAVLLVASRHGTHALRIDADGTFEPVAVVEE
jgi:hypothetical protein